LGPHGPNVWPKAGALQPKIACCFKACNAPIDASLRPDFDCLVRSFWSGFAHVSSVQVIQAIGAGLDASSIARAGPGE
jgi:hypothetical protein